jgi:hypothetical protein
MVRYHTYRIVYPVKAVRTPERLRVVLPKTAKKITGIATHHSIGLSDTAHGTPQQGLTYHSRIGSLSVAINNRAVDLGQLPVAATGHFEYLGEMIEQANYPPDFHLMEEAVVVGSEVDLIYWNEWNGVMANSYVVSIIFRCEGD